jgi:hypothetical protein
LIHDIFSFDLSKDIIEIIRKVSGELKWK